MMQNDLHNLIGTIRAAVLGILIFAFVVLCTTDSGLEEERPEPETMEEPELHYLEPPGEKIYDLTISKTGLLPIESVPTAREVKEPETVQSAWINDGTYTLTAYCSCEKCCGYWATIRPLDQNGNPIVYTSTGAIAKAGTTIAVDPGIIPYGTEVKIGDQTYIAQDTGGAIKGNRIDVYFDDHQEALEFGRQTAEVFLKTE